MRRAWIPAALLLAACPAATDPIAECVVAEDAAMLSVARAGDTVWVAGAQKTAAGPGTLLRYRDGAWAELETGTLHDLWWVHAFEDGPAFVGGGGATVLRVDGDTVERTPTPVFFGNTVYGVWGASPDDLWAVGGFAGRDGFIWRYDGAAWTELRVPPLPANDRGEPPALFKVWGRSAGDVWIVGGRGAVLRWNGVVLTTVDVPTDEQLFTVAGSDDEVAIVGGSTAGVLLRGSDELVVDTPPGAPLLQAAAFDDRGRLWVAGADGYAAVSRRVGDWEPVDLETGSPPQSIHALFADADGVWAVGGNVLTPELDAGVVASSEDVPFFTQEPEPEPSTDCPADRIDIAPDASMAQRWIEVLLDGVRRDFPHPPKHARNLFHTSGAMYDAWAAYDPLPDGVEVLEKLDGTEADRQTAIAHAALRMIEHRYATAIGGKTTLQCAAAFAEALGLDPTDTRTEGDDPVAFGNRVGQTWIDAYADDGANEANELEDTTGWEPANPVMIVDQAGTNVVDPDVWQQLNLGTAETQNGIVLEDSVQPYIGPHWASVTPFALELNPDTGLYSEPGVYPTVADPVIAEQVVEVIAYTRELDIDDGSTLDIGPASRGNSTVGTNDGTGYALNPVTGLPYEPNVVPRGDFARVVAEMWADGPTSETPPGHWFNLATQVTERLAPEDKVPYGVGEPVDELAWDIGFYVAVGGAVHDAAISAWELKRDSLGARPITLVRWMAGNGQRTEPEADDYHPDGIPLVEGLIERITAESTAPGERHERLHPYVGEIAVFSWPGEPGDRDRDYTPLRWMRAADWIPYQRRTFVTPAFPGYTSGHSTFSRAAAEAMAAYTGSEFFPGGMHEFVARAGEYLIFERGPSVDVRLQWATYYDAADQAGESRLWGGIHVFADDETGRINGQRAGQLAAARAERLWNGTER
jgi:hypothetical protein